MRKRDDSKKWRVFCFKIAQEIDKASSLVRYAEKPSDLNYPCTLLLQLARRVLVHRDKWLEHWLKSKNVNLALWPKLWERYL